MLDGGCYCGFVRYRVEGTPVHETLCHCSSCRRASGAPMVAWFSVPIEGYRVVSGEPVSFRSSRRATRSFCPRCGTPLTYQADAFPDEIDVTTCSLDVPERVPPRDHTRTSAKLPRVELDPRLPAFPETRE